MRRCLCGLISLLLWTSCLADVFDVAVVDEVTGETLEAYTCRVYSADGNWLAGYPASPKWTAQPADLPCELRVVADGYLPGKSELLTVDGSRDVLIQLTPQERIEGVVLGKDGLPIHQAQVTLVQRGRPVVIQAGRATKAADEFSISTDEKGWFSLPLKGSDWGLLATHPSGAAFYLATELPEDVKLTIVPWASCEGVLHEHGKPAAGKGVTAEVLFYNMKDYLAIAPATTADDGKWSLEHLVAKAGAIEQIYYTVGRELRPAPKVIVAQRYEAPVVAGAKLKIDMIRKGVDVVGRVIVLPERAATVDWQQSTAGLLVELPPVKLPPGYEGFTRQQQQAWWAEYEQSGDGKARKAILSAHPQRYQQAMITEEGTFRFIDVPPGRFKLTAYVLPRVPEGVDPDAQDPVVHIAQALDVPPEADGVEDGVLDLGVLAP